MLTLVLTVHVDPQVCALQMLNANYADMHMNTLRTHDHIRYAHPATLNLQRAESFELTAGESREVCLEIDTKLANAIRWRFQTDETAGTESRVKFAIKVVSSGLGLTSPPASSSRSLSSASAPASEAAAPSATAADGELRKVFETEGTVRRSDSGEAFLCPELGERAFVCFKFQLPVVAATAAAALSGFFGCASRTSVATVHFRTELVPPPPPPPPLP